MLSWTRVLVLASLLGASAIFAAPAQDDGVELETRSYPLSGRGNLILTVPATWPESVDTSAATGGVNEMNLQYESDEPLGWTFVVSAFWNPDKRTAASAEELRADVKKTGKQYRGRVVESQISIREARGDDTLLYYFSVTDTEQKPGEYVYMTQGIARIGHVLAAFTILSNGQRAEIERQALEILRTATHEWEGGS